MSQSSPPPDWYAEQAKLAALQLDFDLHMAACEAEIKSGIQVNFTPMPEPEPTSQKTQNSVYNLNELLDAFS